MNKKLTTQDKLVEIGEYLNKSSYHTESYVDVLDMIYDLVVKLKEIEKAVLYCLNRK